MYAIQVPDDAMVDAGLKRGDIALVANISPKRGDIVAFESKGRLELRRYLFIAGIPHLLAENSVQPDLRQAFDVATHGVLWGLIRIEQCGSTTLNAVFDLVKRAGDAGDRLAKTSEISRKGRGVRKSKRRSISYGKAQPSDGARNLNAMLRKPDAATDGWPEPPFGIMLNDISTVGYRCLPPNR